MEIRDQLHAPAALLAESEPTTRSIRTCVIRIVCMNVLEIEEFLASKIALPFWSWYELSAERHRQKETGDTESNQRTKVLDKGMWPEYT